MNKVVPCIGACILICIVLYFKMLLNLPDDSIFLQSIHDEL